MIEHFELVVGAYGPAPALVPGCQQVVSAVVKRDASLRDMRRALELQVQTPDREQEQLKLNSFSSGSTMGAREAVALPNFSHLFHKSLKISSVMANQMILALLLAMN
jgi:hypothetical protein